DNNDLVNVSAGIFVAPGLLNFLDGTDLLNGASITDSIDPLGNLPFDDLGVDASEVQALATNKNGETYGFNVVDGFDNGLPVKLVQLIEFQVDGINVGQGNVVAHLQGVLPLDDDGFSTVDSVQAAAFDPASGLLYFVAEANELGALVDRLYTVDVTAGDAAAIAATVTQISGSFGEVTPTIDPNAVASAVDTQKVRSIVFDQLTDTPGLETSRLIALIDTVEATPQPGFTVGDWVSTGVFQVTLTDTDTLTILGAPVPAVEGPATAALGPNVGGIELISNDPLSDGHDNPSGQDDTLLAIQGTDANSQFLLIDLAAGTVTLEGLAVDLADTEGVVRGKSIGALTFDPTLLSPFTGRLGAYVGIDTATDEFVYVNPLGGKADNILDNHVGNNLDMIAEMGIRRDLGAADA
ncbi:MAG: hypothetical protein MI802_01770, partial [Desulfobacterales bacterium]|nr:hypothetical protein [Desulfobacterales bacterium]